MTIIKNHFEVFLVTSKNRIIESKVGLYSIKASSHIFVSCGQDSMSGIVLIINSPLTARKAGKLKFVYCPL
jgi:hypothetical protein